VPSLVDIGGNQRARLPDLRMAPEYSAAVTTAKPLEGFEVRWAEVRGVRLRYYAGGSGPPVVLVHGLGGAGANWVSVAPALAARHTVLIPDLPGHAGSAGVPALPNLAPFAGAVHAVAAREGALPAVFVGHSLGAVVAIRHAVRWGSDTSGLVLAGAAGIRSSTTFAEILLTLAAFVQPGRRLAPFRARIARSDRLRAAVFGGWGASNPAALAPEAAEALLADVPLHTDVASAAGALVADDPRTLLRSVRCPSLVLWGARDNQVPIADAFEYARRLRAGLRVIADCGHLLIVERPDACVDAIESLFSGA
jgi:pimeloyl-ACP methyl ester carboxylesterase